MNEDSKNGPAAVRRRLLLIVPLVLASFLLLPVSWASAGQNADDDLPRFVKLEIGHRVHIDFHEELSVPMNERHYIGDTDFSFEVTAFYPHFAIVDSTHEIVSLSDELKNPAFKILVYENDELVDETWAFYAVNVPHYSRTSLISFQAKAFEYRGVLYEKETQEGGSAPAGDEAHTRRAKESEG